MFRLLNVAAKGYRGLKHKSTLSFLTLARVSEEDLSNQVFEIEKNLRAFKSLAVVGPNSSGKSTVLNLIVDALSILKHGRLPYRKFDFENDEIELDMDFYLDGNIYFYSTKLGKPLLQEPGISQEGPLFDVFKSQTLKVTPYKPYKGNGVVERRESASDVTEKYLSKSIPDTSSISELTGRSVFFDCFTTNIAEDFGEVLIRNTFYTLIKSADPSALAPTLALLDDSIEKIEATEPNLFLFKRKGKEEIKLNTAKLASLLSMGTMRGTEMFLRAFFAIKNGYVFIVDEIENSFHKDIVNNLILLFNDPKTNPKGATLVFSTHLTESLDVMSRTDSVYITHRGEDGIRITNLKNDHRLRSGLLTSRQLDSGIFGTGINYDSTIEVRRAFARGAQTDLS